MFSATQALRARGLRATPQRIAVYEALRPRKDHPTVDMIYDQVREQFPTISLNTVYTTLCAMEKTGLIRRIDAGDGLSRYDGNPAPHAHIVCTNCLRVDDLTLETDLDTRTLTKRAERISGYTVDGYAIYFYGRCPGCNEKR